MRRSPLALAGALAFLLLLAPMAEAAAHGARQPIAVGQTVLDVALASGGARFAAGNSDPGSRFTGTASSPTWTLWNIDGSTRSTGGVDPVACPNPPLEQAQEDCDTDATHVALSANGAKVAVAGRVTASGPSTLAIFTDAGTRLGQVSVPGAIQDIAIDPLGERVAAVSVVATGSAANPEDGFIGLWTADAAMSTLIEKEDLPLGVTSVDLTRDVLVAGAGNTHYLFSVPSDFAYTASSISGNILDVDAAAAHADGWSVAGYSSGFFALFSDRPSSGHADPSVPDYQKREAGETSAANAVAIRDDGSAFAVAHDAGRLRLYSLNPATGLPNTEVALMAERSGLGTIDDLAFSGDGRYLAVRSDGTVRLYHTGSGSLEEMWSDTRTAVADSLAIDGDGDHVAIGSGTSVILYDAIHRITPTLPSASHQPGTTRSYDLVYRNDGNRAEGLSLQAQPPSGVTVSLSPTDFLLLPGASRTVQATVTVPATWGPGSLPVPLRLSINGGADGTPTTNLGLTIPTVHRISMTAPDGDNKGANGGAPATFAIDVANAGNVAETVQLTLTGLGGWSGDVEPSSLTLQPGATADVTVTLQPPAGAADGTTQLAQLEASVAGSPALPLRATVGANFAVRLTAPSGVLLNPGVNGVVDLTVRNDGNTVDDVLVQMPTLPSGWLGGFLGGQAETQVSDLGPGESRTVQASVRPPADFVSDVPTQLTFRAQSLGDATRASDARVLFTVQQATSTTTGGDGGGGGGNGIPGPSPLLLVAALTAVALAARRRA